MIKAFWKRFDRINEHGMLLQVLAMLAIVAVPLVLIPAIIVAITGNMDLGFFTGFILTVMMLISRVAADINK